MKILLFMPGFAAVPLSSLLLLALAALTFALPIKERSAAVFALAITTAAVSLGVLANADKLLLAAALLLSVCLGLALKGRRDRS